MSKREPSKPIKRRRPARTPEGRENQLISMAYDRVEQQIADGTASSQVLTHFLKLGTEREKLERAKLEADTQLAVAKVKGAETNERLEKKYDDALNAMRMYQGFTESEDEQPENI